MYKRENFGCGCRSSESYKEDKEDFIKENFQCGCSFTKTKSSKSNKIISEDYRVNPINKCGR